MTSFRSISRTAAPANVQWINAAGTARRCAGIVAMTVIAGCTGDSRPGSPAWLGDSLPSNGDDIEIVRVDPLALNALPLLSPTPTLVIGTGSGGGTDDLGWIAGIAIDSGGRVYLSDPVSHRIRVYGPDGSFLRDIGRNGFGPGEFAALHGEIEGRGVNGITISGDTLFAISDRISAFDTSGAFLYSSGPEVQYYDAASVTATSKGIVVDRRVPRNYVEQAYVFTLELPASGTILQSFSALERYVDFEHRGIVYRKPSPLPFLPFTVANDARVYMVTGDTFSISVVNMDGRVERMYVAQLPRIRLSDSDISDLGASLERLLTDRQTGKPTVDLSTVIEQGPRAEYRPAIGDLVVSGSGTMFIHRTDVSPRPFDWYGNDSKSEWVMIDSAGIPRGRFLLANGFRAKVLSNCELYGVDERTDGAQVAVRYTLRKSGPGC